MCSPGEGASIAGCDDVTCHEDHHIKSEPTYVAYRWGKPLAGDSHLHNGSPGKLTTTCNHNDVKDYAGISFGDRQLCTPLLTKGTPPPTNYGHHTLPHCNCCHLSANRCLHKESLPSTNSSPNSRRINTTSSSSDTLDKFPTNDNGGNIPPHYLIFDPDVIPDQTRSNSSTSGGTSSSGARKPLSTFLGKKNDPERKNSFPMSILKQPQGQGQSQPPQPANNVHTSPSALQDSQDSIASIGACPRHSGTNQNTDSTSTKPAGPSQTQSQSSQKVKDSSQGLKKCAAAASMEDLENDANERKKLEVYSWQ